MMKRKGRTPVLYQACGFLKKLIEGSSSLVPPLILIPKTYSVSSVVASPQKQCSFFLSFPFTTSLYVDLHLSETVAHVCHSI